MAIADVQQFAHLTDDDVEALGRAFDEIRRDIEAKRGQEDADYIRRIIAVQRSLAVAGRAALFAGLFPPAWIAGTAMLSVSKILENMEIGHNVMHGQFDWMNDPEIHSSTWEWDTVQPADQWKHSHNYLHHTFTNVIGKDKDVGYEILRMAPEQPWHPVTLGQPVYNFLLAVLFQWGVALHDLDIEGVWHRDLDAKEMKGKLGGIWRKVRKQVAKDYLLFPALTGPAFLSTLAANATANLARNVWSYMIIFCGHFPDGALQFTEDELDDETQAKWYLRQLHGSANFTGSRLLHILSGSLGYQIEHHLYPDLPCYRYPEIAERVQELCREYDLTYTTGPLYKQYGQVLRTILKLSLPNRVIGLPTPPRSARRKSASGPQSVSAAA
jgi:fatty acid desaturase